MPSKRDRAKWAARREFENIVRMLRPGDVAIDCGANVGEFTEKMARTGATVYAFEPDPYCVEILREKFSNSPNVKVYASAVGDEDLEIYLYRAAGFDKDPIKLSKSSSVFANKRNINTIAAIPIQQIDFIKFVRDIPNSVSLLKMDIEDAEVAIMAKLFETGQISRINRCFVETHEEVIPELSHQVREIQKQADKLGSNQINLQWR
jgi:FkbM family methyltransferase